MLKNYPSTKRGEEMKDFDREFKQMHDAVHNAMATSHGSIIRPDCLDEYGFSVVSSKSDVNISGCCSNWHDPTPCSPKTGFSPV